MAFSLSGTIVTQTAPLADFSLLGAIAGVTEIQVSPFKKLYVLSTSITRLILTDIDLDPEIEGLVFQTTSADCLYLTGLFRVGQETTVNGLTRYSKGMAITFSRESVSQHIIETMNVRTGGSFEWRGGDIISPSAMGCQSTGGNSPVEIFDGRFICTNDVTGAMVMRNDGWASQVIIHSLTLDARDPSIGVPIIFSRNGITQQSYTIFAGAFQMRTGVTSGVATLRDFSVANNAFTHDYEFNGNGSNYGNMQGGVTINSDVGTGLRVVQSDPNTVDSGHVAMYQELYVLGEDLEGNEVDDMKVYIPTTDSGNRVNAYATTDNWQDSVDFTQGQFDSYTEVTVGGSTPLITVLLGRVWFIHTTPTSSDRFDFPRDFYHKGQTDGDDNFDLFTASYNHAPNSREVVLKMLGVQTEKFVMLPDDNLTYATGDNIADMAVVDAYTELIIPQDLYDRQKSWWIQNLLPSHPLLLSLAGDIINAGDYDVIIDPSASSVFDFSGGLITIKAGVFTGSIFTTGGVYLRNGAMVQGGEFGKLVLESGHGSEVTMADVVAAEVVNTSGVDVALTLSGSGAVGAVTDTSGGLFIVSTLKVVDVVGDEFKIIAWDASDITDGAEILEHSSGVEHSVPTNGVAVVHFIVDKPEHYAKIYSVPITSTNEVVTVSMTRSPAVDVTVDIQALIDATVIENISDPYGLGFDVLRATLDADFGGVTASQWRRYHDYFSEDEVGLSILGLNSLDGDQVYETTASGVAILRPTLEVMPDGLEEITTSAYIDVSVAQSLLPYYDYTPRNEFNVAVEAATSSPLVDYDEVEDILDGLVTEKLDKILNNSAVAALNSVK